jgi:DNA-binding SARP family transcriptional activator
VLEFRLLGPFSAVRGDGGTVPLGRRQERLLLALLLLELGKVVSVERLAELIWTEEPPGLPRSTLRSYVARLRGSLAPHGLTIATHGGGYVVDADPAAVDAHRFTALLRSAQGADEPADRIVLLEQALRLWRGPLLTDVADAALRARIGGSLEHQHLRAAELLATARIEVGRLDEAIWQLQQLADQHPTRETVAELLMRAHDRAGNADAALAAFDTVRHQLREQLGVNPGAQLVAVHAEILRRGSAALPATQPAAARRPGSVPRQLPADIADFAARGDDLDRLDRLLAQSGRPGPPVAAIVGMAGIGKSTLAVHWAHRVAGRFPDGQLYVNLNGFDPAGPVPAEDAVRGFLEALHVLPKSLPTGPSAQAALLRSTLADRDVLVVIDNARNADHVRPLLPGTARNMVVVTSRNDLTGLVLGGAAHIALDILDAREGREMLVRRLSPERVAREPHAVDQLVELCAGLPLALAIVAAHATVQPQLPLSRLVAELQEARGSLTAFAGSEATTDVHSVFSWSYQALSADAAVLLRLLSLHPGPTLDRQAAVSLTGWPPDRARHALAELVRAHLVLEDRPGRFGLHDLLRAYAAGLLQQTDGEASRQAATGRLLDHYLHSAHRADRALDPHRDTITLTDAATGTAAAVFTGPADAMAWFQREHQTLLSLLEQPALRASPGHAWQLAWVVANFLDRHGHWHDLDHTQQQALRSARALGDLPGQARCCRMLARCAARLGRHDKGLEHLALALDLHTALGDGAGQAYTHLNINLMLEGQQRWPEALQHAHRSLHLFTAAGDVVGRSRALNAIGWGLAHLGRHAEALDHCNQALALHRHIGSHGAEADTWDSVGFIHLQTGALADAAEAYRQALDLTRRLGDRYEEAMVLLRLADVCDRQDDGPAAHELRTQALAIAQHLDHLSAADVWAVLDRTPAG